MTRVDGMKGSRSRRQAMTAAALVGVVAAMVGLSFASVPLYRLFCQVTGYGGTPKTEDVARDVTVSNEMVSVRFDANVNTKLPWRFVPAQREVQVRLGEEMLVFYEAANLADTPITGTATFNVSPYKAAQYFNKIDCFCFTEQRLEPGETISMPVLFYVDPEIFDDVNAQDVKVVTLSYTFYRSEGEDDAKAVAEMTPARGAGN